jgi:protein involved in polysaccharide export with SLBB domain
MKIRVVKFICLLLFFASCSSNKEQEVNYEVATNPQKISNSKVLKKLRDEESIPNQYIVAPGYRFKLSHVNDKDLKGIYTVNWKGYLWLPYKVRVKASGLTVSKLREEVQGAYKKFFKNEGPEVQVRFIQRRYYVKIEGVVNKPGTYSFKYDSNIDEVISKAGGLKVGVEVEFVMVDIVQGTGDKVSIPLVEYYQTGDSSLVPYWSGSDKVFISTIGSRDLTKNNIVTVLGEVKASGAIPYVSKGDIYYYISKAKGFTRDADLERIEVVRGSGASKRSIVFNLKDINKVPVIFPSDTIVLHTDKPRFWEKVLDKVVSLSTILTSIAFIIIAL